MKVPRSSVGQPASEPDWRRGHPVEISDQASWHPWKARTREHSVATAPSAVTAPDAGLDAVCEPPDGSVRCTGAGPRARPDWLPPGMRALSGPTQCRALCSVPIRHRPPPSRIPHQGVLLLGGGRWPPVQYFNDYSMDSVNSSLIRRGLPRVRSRPFRTTQSPSRLRKPPEPRQSTRRG